MSERCKVCNHEERKKIDALRLNHPKISLQQIADYCDHKLGFSVSRDTLGRHFRNHVEIPKAEKESECLICASGAAEKVDEYHKRGVAPALIGQFLRDIGVKAAESDIRSHIQHGIVLVPKKVEDESMARVEEFEQNTSLSKLDVIEELLDIIKLRKERIARLQYEIEVLAPNPKTLKEIDALENSIMNYRRLQSEVGEIDEVKRARTNILIINQLKRNMPKGDLLEDMIEALRKRTVYLEEKSA